MRLFKWNESASQKRWSSNDGQDTEANAVISIRGMCLTARVAAEITAADSENTDAHRAYLNAKEKCIAAAEGISDRFYRDTALHFIYVLCQRANDDAAAKRIFDQITTYEIRGNILDGRPSLFD
jgi:hypothetical protein